MFQFERISAEIAQAKSNASPCTIIDIRDDASFEAGHIENAQHINNGNLAKFIAEADQSLPLLVYCYHGNSSQGAAQMLAEQGFKEAYSVDGGYEHWQALAK